MNQISLKFMKIDYNDVLHCIQFDFTNDALKPSPQVADETVNDPSTLAIRAFNDLVKDDQRVDISFLTIGDGLTLLFIR